MSEQKITRRQARLIESVVARVVGRDPGWASKAEAISDQLAQAFGAINRLKNAKKPSRKTR